ncbi:MAG: phytanoyl-CoA dioxygenase family protein [Proteobacteria bacterium]|nr:phytanoyl-CoA dioxygenase family protein [Pseudomonadota bacterium]MBS0574208.1 phytanoyl-CoA dioxygenase family protein [Pseudomonadota bacterium]
MVARGAGAPGWRLFAAEPATLGWAAAALRAARTALERPGGDWRCGGTWFVGVDALDNGRDGSVAGVPLAGRAVAEALGRHGPQVWHRAQLSAVRPGYPRPSDGESPAAFDFRLRRDAAHVDGLIAEGADKRRFVREPHAFILGIALNDSGPGASPLAVWEGSHLPMRAAFRDALAGTAPADLGRTDVTDAYQAARRRVLAECPRRLVPMKAGEAVLIDRHLLHGVSPWETGAEAPPEGRIIAYFRPQLADVAAWLAG